MAVAVSILFLYKDIYVYQISHFKYWHFIILGSYVHKLIRLCKSSAFGQKRESPILEGIIIDKFINPKSCLL